MDHILLLEDIPEIRAWLKALVQQVFPRSQVLECARVGDALAAIPRQRFELALIDLGLPDGSGVQVVEALRDRQPEAQAVIVTIHDDDEHLFPALQAGAFGYLLKEQARELLVEHAGVPAQVVQAQEVVQAPAAGTKLASLMLNTAVLSCSMYRCWM